MGLDPTRRIDQYAHDVWTSQHGLPGEAVYQILQSRDGYLWLRTSAGLVRFDGVRFTQMDSAIGSEPVKAMTMSADGDILVRTISRTVVYRGGQFADYRAQTPIPDGELKAIYETREHEVLAGADDFLYAIDAGGPRMIKRGTAAITSFLEDDKGMVWGAGASSLIAYQSGAVRDDRTVPLLSSAETIMEDRARRIWVGTTGGLFQMDPGGAERPRALRAFPQITGEVKAIVEDRQGNFWLGTGQSGLLRIHDGKVSSFGYVDGLTDNAVLSVYEDHEGSLWIGTGNGLDRLRDTKALTYTTNEGLPTNNAKSAVTSKDGTVYVFCDGGGLAGIKNGVVTASTKIGKLKVFFGSSMFEDSNGSLWMGTIGGLTRLKDGKFTVYSSDPRVAKPFTSAINEDDESLVLTTSETLALRFKNEKTEPFTIRGQMTPLSVPGNYSFTVYRDPDKNLWFGTVKGLFRFAPGHSPADAWVSQVDFPVTSISPDGRGSLWLGGRTAGLIRYRIADGRVTHYRKKDGLFDGSPSRVLFDDAGNPWMSTPDGIYWARRQDMDDFADGRLTTVPSTVYGTADGMKTSEASSPSSQPGGARGLDGKLWFTTARGVVMIDPRHILHNDLVPPVVIENVLIDSRPAPGGTPFKLPPGSDKIEFHYTALSLLIPERVRFKYQLQGYDHGWVDAGPRRVAYYNNLPPGNYRFRVVAANDDGVWNTDGASIGFRLLPHFYQTGWFRGLAALVVLLVIVAGQRLSTRLIRRRAEELGRLVDERTAELRESQFHLEQVAFLDSLTALPNRRMFTQEFGKMLARSERREGNFSLLMIDLDQFKRINDTLGHDAGDALLVETAARLKSAVREADCVARLGGDEFVVLLWGDQDKDTIDTICQRILDNFGSPVTFSGEEMKTTPSIGIAIFPDHGETQDSLCKSADMALYEVKRAGGNSWRWFGAGARVENIYAD